MSRTASADASTRYALLAGACLLGIASGLVLSAMHRDHAADVVWTATVATMLVPLTWSVAAALWHGRLGVDVIALIAMVGALAVHQELAGAVIALMLAGGNALEAVAGRRARRDLTALLARAPSIAHIERDATVLEVPVGDVRTGDVVIVRAGEIVPVDALLADPHALLDEATLTGESLPVARTKGALVRSGVGNAGAPFRARAVRPAAESAYAALVALVERAQQDRAPFVRLADRYAVVLLPLTLLLAGVAWLSSGDPVRALAVVVVATPCPLILAAPIAFVGGISRAAGRGIIVKGGGVIERLGRVRTALLDKTGTLTLGTPRIKDVAVHDGVAADEIVRLAASLDQLSAHAIAEGLVHDAEERGMTLAFPAAVHEEPGQGIEGVVEGRRVAVGGLGWMRRRGFTDSMDSAASSEAGLARISVSADGRLLGTITMADHVRPDAEALVRDLRAAGIGHIAMVSGDRAAVAAGIGEQLGLDRVYADQTPEEKLDVVHALRADETLAPVMMVGDGINDAPALALADVGIAMGVRGATATSEAADAVIAVDRIDRVADAVRIGRRSLRIATQSVVAGMALSVVAMCAAAAGLIVPVAGALLQEAIDVAVIVNALRVLHD